MKLDTLGLQAFVGIVDHGTFAKAAQSLNISQTALSHRLKRLEGELRARLLDRTTRILHESHQRSPMLDEARLLADAVNLDDFGITGLLQQMTQLARDGEGVVQLAKGAQTREQYGYWEARLKDGFHFDPVREMARRRLDGARLVVTLLMEELEWGEA